MPPPLEVRHITAGYHGAAPVLRDVAFSVERGRILGLIGPNGAGKSTLFDVVCGTLKPAAGQVLLEGRDVSRLPAHRRARLGLGRTFQQLEPFGSLAVADNLLVAAEAARAADPRGTTRATLRRFGLVDFADQPVGLIPTGIARIVEIARALAAGARVLLLDEPSSGMGEAQVLEFADTVRSLAAQGLSVVLVEHDLGLVRAVCDPVYELNRAGGSRPAPSTSE